MGRALALIAGVISAFFVFYTVRLLVVTSFLSPALARAAAEAFDRRHRLSSSSTLLRLDRCARLAPNTPSHHSAR